MYLLIITQSYHDFKFEFDDMETLADFIETAMKHACGDYKYEIKKIKKECENDD